MKKIVIKPKRVAILAVVVFLIAARRTGAIAVKGYCKEHDVEFELPPRTEALIRVKCPKGGEKILRSKAVIAYLVKRKGEKK